MSVYPGLKTRLDQVLADFKVRASERNFAQAAYNVLIDLDKRLDALEAGGVPAPGGVVIPAFNTAPSEVTLNRTAFQVGEITDALRGDA